MTEDELDILLRIAGIKPAYLWGTRIETKLDALKGTQRYVDRHGHLTAEGRREIERYRREAQRAG